EEGRGAEEGGDPGDAEADRPDEREDGEEGRPEENGGLAQRPAVLAPQERRDEEPAEEQNEEEPEDVRRLNPRRHALRVAAHAGPDVAFDPERQSDRRRHGNRDQGGQQSASRRREALSRERDDDRDRREEPGDERSVPGVGQDEHARDGAEQRAFRRALEEA